MFLLLPPMCVDLYFLFVCVVFYGQKVDIGMLSIIGLPERAKPNQEMRSTIFLCQKKRQNGGRISQRVCISHSLFNKADFLGERA